MQIEISREDLINARDFVESGVLVSVMNDEGLSISSMSIILDTLFKGFDELEEKFNAEI